MAQEDELDLADEPEEPEASISERPRHEAPPPATGFVPPDTSGTPPRRGRGLQIVVVVVVLLAVVGGATVYALKFAPATRTPATPPPRYTGPCLGDLQDTWPTYLGEVTRNAQNCGEHVLSSSNANQLAVKWTYNTSFESPGFLQAEPVVANGTVYVGAGNGVFYALNATTGQLVWNSTNLGTNVLCTGPGAEPLGITSTATVANGLVYVGGGDANFYALDEATGAVAWSFYVGDPLLGYYNWASPLVLPAHDSVYIGVASNCDNPLVNGGLDQVSLSTHQLVHFFSDLSPVQASQCNNSLPPPHENTSPGCGGSIWGSPAYDAATNTVWAATGNGYNLSTPQYGDSLMEWNASTLALVSHWTLPTARQVHDGDFGATPTLIRTNTNQSMVFLTNKNTWSYAFNETDIAQGPVWSYSLSGGHPLTPDAYGGGLVYLPGEGATVHGQFYGGVLYAFQPEVNRSVWAVGLAGRPYGAPVYANGLVVATGGNTLYVLNSTTGQILYSYVASQPFLAAASVANGMIYVGNTNGLVLAFGLPSGTAVSSSPTPTPGSLGTPGGPASLIMAPSRSSVVRR